LSNKVGEKIPKSKKKSLEVVGKSGETLTKSLPRGGEQKRTGLALIGVKKGETKKKLRRVTLGKLLGQWRTQDV